MMRVANRRWAWKLKLRLGVCTKYRYREMIIHTPGLIGYGNLLTT